MKPAANTVNTVLSIGGDFFNGIASWGREKLMEKFSYVTDQPIDALKSLGETAWNTLVGFFVGGYGMPGGALGFEAREAHSPFYLIGSMLSVFNPLTDTLSGIRDLSANLLKGDALGVAIEAVGLLPVGGFAGDAKDIIEITKTWVKSFPNKAAKALKPVSNLILDPISKMSPKAKGAIQTIKEKFPGAAKRGDDAASNGKKALPPGKKVKALPPSIDDLAKRDDIVGYTKKRMNRLKKSEEFTNTDLKRFAERGVDLRKVVKLSNSGVSNAKIKALTKTDADIDVAARLSRQGFTGDRLIHIVKHGEEAYPKLTLEDAEELKGMGYTSEDIVSISKNAQSKYPVRVKGMKNPGSGVTKKQLIELRKQEVPAEDVRHYVRNSYSLKLVSFLREQGHSSGRLRKLFLGSPKKVKRRIKQGRKFRDHGSTIASMLKDTRGWCKMKKKRGKTVKTCRYVP